MSEKDVSTVLVVGLGYVGLPLIEEAVKAGYAVAGLDRSKAIVEGLNGGRSHVDDISDAQVSGWLEAGFQASTDASCAGAAQAIIICVPTPLAKSGGPDLAAVRSACASVAPYLKRGALVVLESTTYPGTTQEVVVPILEQGSGLEVERDFYVASSPERIDPGNVRFGFRNTPKIVGADAPESKRLVVDLYSRMVDEVVEARGTREAEAAKLLENTYRQVNIALVNEMVKFFHDMGIDFWNVIELAKTKPFGFTAFYPGPGVGGHCIPIDPGYLSHRVQTQLGYPFRFVELAQEINRSMPTYVVSRAQALLNDERLPVRGSRILLIGVTYKADISDQRESPALDVAQGLIELGADLFYCDPYVSSWVPGVNCLPADELATRVGEFDLAVLLQAHKVLDLGALEGSGTLLLDTQGKLNGEQVFRL
jgi:UDP-N-acetyl-D-glucosamine dehydrogenase